MKLRGKITIICGSVLIMTVLLICGVFLNQTRSNVLSISCGKLLQQYQETETAFRNVYKEVCMDNVSPYTERAWIRFCMMQVGTGSEILVNRGEIVFAPVTLPSAAAVKLSEFSEHDVFIAAKQGKRILILGAPMAESEMQLYVFADVSDVYSNLERLFFQCILLCAAGIAVGLWLIGILVGSVLRPLSRLEHTAALIASGRYEERTNLCSPDEIGMLAASFDRMAESVQSKVDALTRITENQKRFISGVTHEFKTPLTGLIMHADALQNVYMDEETRSQSLAAIEKESLWLEQLVQKLLKLMTADQQPELCDIDAKSFLEDVGESVQPTFREKGVRLVLECGTPFCRVDPVLMKSVLVNLCENAAKASKPGDAVILRADASGFTVQDFGVGIPQKDVSRVTEPFYMVDPSRSKQLGGTGLGLALAERIVNAHGAQLYIESELGKGTTVRVIFPNT